MGTRVHGHMFIKNESLKLLMVRSGICLFLQMRPWRPSVANDLPKVMQVVRG